jgi:hypothetical protein
MVSPLSTAKRVVAAAAAVLLAASVSARQPNAVKRIPLIEGEWWQVAGNPDLGVLGSDEQEPVDFGIWAAADGTWVCSLPVAAPELIQHEGQWYIAALRRELDGIRIARLAWDVAE